VCILHSPIVAFRVCQGGCFFFLVAFLAIMLQWRTFQNLSIAPNVASTFLVVISMCVYVGALVGTRSSSELWVTADVSKQAQLLRTVALDVVAISDATCIHNDKYGNFVDFLFFPVLIIWASMIALFKPIVMAVRQQKQTSVPSASKVPEIMNVAGTIAQLGITAFLVFLAMPFSCYAHSSGERSMTVESELFCGTKEHTKIALTAGFWLLIVCCFVAWIISATRRLPSIVESRKNKKKYIFGKTFKFILCPYRTLRPWAYHWQHACILRGCVLATLAIVQPDDVYNQIIWSIGAFTVYLSVETAIMPWKLGALYFFEMITMFFLCIVLFTGFTVMERAEEDHFLIDLQLPLVAGPYFVVLLSIGNALVRMVMMGTVSAFRNTRKPFMTLAFAKPTLKKRWSKFIHVQDTYFFMKFLDMLNTCGNLPAQTLPNRLALSNAAFSTKAASMLDALGVA